MVYVVVIIIVFYLILLFPLKIRVIRNDNNNDIDLYLIKSLNLQVDIDEAISKLYSKDEKSSTLNTVINILKIYKSKSFLKSVIKSSKIKKITVVINNRGNEDSKILTGCFSWLIVSEIRNYILNNFKHVKNEYYMVNNQATGKTLLNFEVILEVRIVYFLFSILYNIKELPKIIKLFKKEGKENE